MKTKMVALPAGSYVLMPRRMHHYAMAKNAALVQVHGVGPFKINYVNPADDPSKAAKIRRLIFSLLAINRSENFSALATAMLNFSAVQFPAGKIFATAETWSFGLCATRSREPRQARKGATVPGSPRVPQITRSSSVRAVVARSRRAQYQPHPSDAHQTRMSYQVIARKWRPQTFRDLVGQEHVTETLANAIRNDRVAHAYIFSGARGVGKTTAARILAKALNCVHGPTAEPCGECDSCREIAAGTSLDVIEIDAASNRGIDQIRELREMVRYAPAGSRSKVVILDEAHMLTTEASNALLKTLEEPPDRVVFVMATTEPENLADTIRSRSQHFHFRALTFREITARLEEIAAKENLQIDAGALAVIARMAEGSMRDALSLLEQARAYCGETIPADASARTARRRSRDALDELVRRHRRRLRRSRSRARSQLSKRRPQPPALLPRSDSSHAQFAGRESLRRGLRFDRRDSRPASRA